MKHSHLKNYTAVARATTRRVLAWLVAAAGAPQQITRRELSSPPTKCRTSTSWPVSQLARVVELLLQLPQQAPATAFSVLPGAALIACADKAHTVNGDGGAEACAVSTHAACTSTLVALRPPLRVCKPFFKLSFLTLGSPLDFGELQTTGRRDATVSSSITSRTRPSTRQPGLSTRTI